MTIQAATRGLEALGSAAIGLICRLEPAQLEVHRSKLGKLGWLIMAVLFFVVIGFSVVRPGAAGGRDNASKDKQAKSGINQSDVAVRRSPAPHGYGKGGKSVG